MHDFFRSQNSLEKVQEINLYQIPSSQLFTDIYKYLQRMDAGADAVIMNRREDAQGRGQGGATVFE